MTTLRRGIARGLWRVGLLLAVGFATPCARGEEFSAGFDADRPEWRLRYDESAVKLLGHRRDPRTFFAGKASEHVEFDVGPAGAIVQLEFDLPPARVIDDLVLSVWCRSNRPGAELAIRLVFPYQKDPATGAVLTTFLRGDVYSQAGRWQQLKCTTLEKQVRERLVLLRAKLRDSQLDARGMYVDRAIVAAKSEAGAVEYFLDELHFAPIVSPRAEPGAIAPAGMDETVDAPVDFRLDRLMVHDAPFFPRLTPYHGERLDVLRQAGVNVAWVPDYKDEDLLTMMQRHGVWAIATPPRPQTASDGSVDAASVSLLPFSPGTSPILAWYGGTRVAPQTRRELVSWSDQVRAADRTFRRPFMVDVTGDEREFSRQVSMLGMSRHVLHTTVSIKEYRDWLVGRRKLARPGSFVWTWIQTEPDSAVVESRLLAHREPAVVEPEQIRLQLYSALAGGCRGIGYWKTGPLDGERPGDAERRLALTQLDLELQLLEPWLATGSLVGQVPFRVKGRPENVVGQRRIGFGDANSQSDRDALLRHRDDQLRGGRGKDELEAALIRGDHGLLLLPVWYERDSQFVPGQLADNDATIVVPGADESASAWEVTPTDIRSVTRERVAGGIRITLPKFDQTAAVILSADRHLIESLRKKMATLAEPSARTSIDLARSKLERTKAIDERLRELGVSQTDGPQLLIRATQHLATAETAFAQQDWHAARQLAADSMQLQRILQRAHWNDAVRNLASPVSSPHAICFQSLPDHWELLARLGRSPAEPGANLLRAGDFEDIDTLVAERWEHAQSPLEGVRASAELYPSAKQGKYGLRLIAVPAPGAEAPVAIRESPVRVSTPPIEVRAGQIVHISGWIRVVSPITGNSDGAMVYDTLGGPVAALRYQLPGDWTRFEMIREAHASGTFAVKIALRGYGEVQLDDLRVVPHTPRTDVAGQPAATGDPRTPTRSPLDFLNRLPGFRPPPTRR